MTDSVLHSLESPAIPSAISRRLDRIESLLKSHSEAIAAISQQQQVLDALCSPQEILDAQAVPTDAIIIEPPIPDPSRVDRLNLTSPLSNTHSSPSSIAGVSPEFNTAQVGRSANLFAPFTAPPKHQTSPVYSLLKLPVIRSLVGELPEDHFFSIESRHVPPAPSTWILSQAELPDIEREVTDRLVDTFFSDIHPCHPILDRDAFFAMYENVMSDGLGLGLHSAFCLVVFALGAVASEAAAVDPQEQYWEPALKYLQPALKILMAESVFSFGTDLQFVQALIFGGICFAYMAKPLHSWKLIHMASTDVQLLLSRSESAAIGESYKERILEACWSCFLLECDYLTELKLPPSGIETLVDDMALPKAGNPSDREGLSYLAEISMRSLLNRVLSSLPNEFESGQLSEESEATGAITVASELDQQLLLWYDSVPEMIKPTLGVGPTADGRERILRIRYYQARYIIHRQFVVYSASLPEDREPSPKVLEEAQVCIESCRLYLQNTGEILKKPSQYTWTLAQSSLDAALVLTTASLSRHLKDLVPDILPLQQLLIDNIARWAAPESSFESILCILGDIVGKQQFH
ncbi:GAL4-like Zn2Cys6 binuclear cluster DNA-binding domain, conidia-enriched transcript [Histoplasma capsulatum var. duboisii H88]|uniref:GAL4-like Zn2Cys6 binuclear cluster DNA-binding domain, conidia-enriched transcript n=1 Tax=Ajellomyces capsulatus (strain H88) TaxID=544711 RepID=A0A8A1LRL4_AJEC8|nr:GAL4-like Zn2Cys6 binuclear cluster DNA-binding domain, conidia-enriched transcript [Histoplasma capsulatum var. duboisii H88]